jgi:hypothetical protein
MSRYKKAFAGMIALMLIAAIIMVVVFILTRFGILQDMLKIKKTLYANIQLDDKGTEILSFLQTGDEISYMCILGAAESGSENELKNIENSLEKISKGYYIAVRDENGKIMKEYKNGVHSATLTIDIPLPNGKTGSVEMMTW